MLRSTVRLALLTLLIVVLALPAAARGEAVDAGALRGEVDPTTGALSFGGASALAEAPAQRLGFD
ncbi:MAG TPA: hypothetical protein VGR12_06250, partial [Solirubrobacteraceae bacterium]|nr:hypothetical protein [Solirubrobacteraceae bacterium]